MEGGEMKGVSTERRPIIKSPSPILQLLLPGFSTIYDNTTYQLG